MRWLNKPTFKPHRYKSHTRLNIRWRKNYFLLVSFCQPTFFPLFSFDKYSFFLLLIKNKSMQCAKLLWTCFNKYLYYLWNFLNEKQRLSSTLQNAMCNKLQTIRNHVFLFFYKKCFKITKKNENNMERVST